MDEYLSITGLPDTIVVNNDDDDNDNQSDQDQSGAVSGEDDLKAVQLDYPEQVKAGAVVILFAPYDRVHVWEHDDRSGTEYISPTRGTYTWTIGSGQAPPQTVYVEAIAGSSVVGEIQLDLAASDAGATP
ncbi:MAG: hypothetical protein ACREJC_08880, partial [Tepidisphaeraceae bacterium]